MQPGEFAENYRNQVIYIESTSYCPHWFHAHGKDKASGKVHLVETTELAVINEVSKQWVVKKKHPTESTIFLESIQF